MYVIINDSLNQIPLKHFTEYIKFLFHSIIDSQISFIYLLRNLGHKPVFQKILFYYRITPGRGIRYMKYISIFLTKVIFIVPCAKWSSIVIR